MNLGFAKTILQIFNPYCPFSAPREMNDKFQRISSLFHSWIIFLVAPGRSKRKATQEDEVLNSLLEGSDPSRRVPSSITRLISRSGQLPSFIRLSKFAVPHAIVKKSIFFKKIYTLLRIKAETKIRYRGSFQIWVYKIDKLGGK